jgi:hypothetical protein
MLCRLKGLTAWGTPVMLCLFANAKGLIDWGTGVML